MVLYLSQIYNNRSMFKNQHCLYKFTNFSLETLLIFYTGKRVFTFGCSNITGSDLDWLFSIFESSSIAFSFRSHDYSIFLKNVQSIRDRSVRIVEIFQDRVIIQSFNFSSLPWNIRESCCLG